MSSCNLFIFIPTLSLYLVSSEITVISQHLQRNWFHDPCIYKTLTAQALYITLHSAIGPLCLQVPCVQYEGLAVHKSLVALHANS